MMETEIRIEDRAAESSKPQPWPGEGSARVALWSGSDFELADVPVGLGREDATVVRTLGAGVCGSDLHILADRAGRIWRDFPVSLGHEILAEVIRVGAGTRVIGGGRLEEGDRIALVPGLPCGWCVTCLSFGANEHLCESRTVHGFGSPARGDGWPIGGFSTGIELLDGLWVQRVPPAMSFERAVLIELVAVAVRAVERGLAGGRPEIGLGNLVTGSAVVVGLGPVGACVALVLKHVGFSVTAIEPNPWRRRWANDALAIETVAGVEGRADTAGGVDLAVECAGVPAAFASAIEFVRRGGRVVELGHFFPNGTIPFDPSQICRKDLDVVGSVLAPPHCYPKAVRLLEDSDQPFERIVSEQIPLEEIGRVAELKARRGYMKAVVVPI